MSTYTANTIRLHRVLQAIPEKIYRAFLDADAKAKLASTERIHRQGSPPGRESRRHLQDVVHQFHHWQKPLLRRHLSRIEALRTHPLYRQIRRPEPARRNAYDNHLEAGVRCTELNFKQEVVPAAIPIEACYLGWQESLTLLAKLVEADEQ